MPQSFLIFDFGTNEEAAQQARHKIEGWTQAFRLKGKMEQRFERVSADGDSGQPAAEQSASEEAPAKKSKSGKGTKGKPAKAPKAEDSEAKAEAAAPDHIRVFVRLQFSDHEKLSHHRWVERLANEEPFKAASPKVVHHSDAGFAPTADLFDSLAYAKPKRAGLTGNQ